MTCDDCDRLRREIRELREELSEWQSGRDPIPDDAIQLAAKIPMNPQCAKVIARLMQHPGHVVKFEGLIEVMGYEGEDTDFGYGKTGSGRALNVVVHNSRRALESIGLFCCIQNVHGIGYYIKKDAAMKLRGIQ